ncbi:MAG: SH3 domain-containing protein, partial [Anaerolineae bacterium]|nr:SH3 domain-containing protein [Anaerolineae bacterium]
MLKRTRILILLLLGAMAFVVGAQDIEPFTPPAEDADIAITFPPPVFAVAGEVEIRGTVDSIGLSEYVIEYRELEPQSADPTQENESPWLPATRPGNQVVRNGVLGIWNTITARDGLYEIRLRATLDTGEEELFRVSPVRVVNNPTEDFVGLPLSVTLQPTPTQIGGTGSRPPLAATPTPLNTGEPMVVAAVDANVRSGDDTTYPRVGSLLSGESAPILGLSSFGSGWYYIQLPNGRRGFIAPSTVNASGDLNNLPPVEPPPPPTPPATATPLTSANLQVTGLRLDP